VGVSEDLKSSGESERFERKGGGRTCSPEIEECFPFIKSMETLRCSVDKASDLNPIG
jgi:hypothetical protein